MKGLLLIICMLITSSIFAYNQQYYQPNIYDSQSNTYDYYDNWGRHQGSARENGNGDIDYYDSWGRKKGTDRRSFDGKGYDHYDEWGRKQGSVRKNNAFGY